MRSKTRHAAVVCAATAMAASVAACGGSGASSDTSQASSAGSGGSRLTDVTLGISPVLGSVNVYYAQQHGLFKQEGLNVKFTLETHGASASFPLLLNKQMDVSVSDAVSPVVAIGKGLPLRVVASGNVLPADPSKDYAGIMVKKGSGISSPAGLAGKSVAVPALNSLMSMLTQATIDADGGDSSSAKFVEVPPLSEASSVSKGQVDAFTNVEPTLTNGQAAGLTLLAHPPASLAQLPVVFLVSSKSFAQANPGVVTKLQAALTKANAALAGKPRLIAKTARQAKEVPPEVADKVIVPTYPKTADVSDSGLSKLMNLMVKYKIISKPLSKTDVLGHS